MRDDALADNRVQSHLPVDSLHLHDAEEVEAAILEGADADIFVERKPQVDHVVPRDNGLADVQSLDRFTLN